MNLPEKPERKFLRLRGYDYSQAGGYYVTIVTQGRVCLFGEVQENEMVLNDAGKMVTKWWNELPGKFPSVTVDAFVVMPNHFHGIIIIHGTGGADLRVGPGMGDGVGETGEHIGSPLRNDGMGTHMEKGAHTGAPLRKDGMDLPLKGTPRVNAPLSEIVQWFKTMTTNAYIQGVKQFNWPRFNGKLWQRNYYEHIVRNAEDYEHIFNYIESNPSNWAEDEENK